MGNLSYADTPCPDRDKLESAVAKAARDVFDAGPEDRESSRRMESAAVKALHQHVAEHGCGASILSAIRCSFTLVAEAESAVAAGEAHKAMLLYREADRAYVAALRELKQLTEREADLMEPAFAELEMRLQPSDMRPHSEDIRKLAGEVATAWRRRNIKPFEGTRFPKL